MQSEVTKQLFIQSKLKEAQDFWDSLLSALYPMDRRLEQEAVLDLGCNFPELFFYLQYTKPETIHSYLGIDQLKENETDDILEGQEGDAIFSRYKVYVGQLLGCEPLPSERFENIFNFRWETAIEDLIKQDIGKTFSFINLRNVLHFIDPAYDDDIISFLKRHLEENGIVYLEVHTPRSTIPHRRPFPFDELRQKKYLDTFQIVNKLENFGSWRVLMGR